MQVHQLCLQHPSSATLDTLNVDVLRLIVDHLHLAALRNLASSSHTLRQHCLPVLFSRCKVDIRGSGLKYPSIPEEVRVHVRHLTHLGPLGKEQNVQYFEALLDCIPSLQSVTIKDASGQVPWRIWKACLSRSHIQSLSYDAGLYDLAIPPFPSDEVEATCVSLQRFSYTTTTWRELTNGAEGMWHLNRRPLSMRPVFEFEQKCLSAIVLRMNKAAVSLTLPLESTSVPSMAELSWPNLKELNLHGRFLDVSQVKHIQHLLPTLPPLARLSILAARTSEVGRPPLLPQPTSNNPGSFSEPLFSQLRVLEIAYPDPMDGMFSIPMPLLSHLALRDQPRMYHNLAQGRPVGEGPMMKHWHTPILLDCEILYILRRMELPHLTSLEIVYGVTAEDSDNELLSYIADAFPHLEHLEIHRYRRNRNMLTQHAGSAHPSSCTGSELTTVTSHVETHRRDPLPCPVSADRPTESGLPRRHPSLLRQLVPPARGGFERFETNADPRSSRPCRPAFPWSMSRSCFTATRRRSGSSSILRDALSGPSLGSWRVTTMLMWNPR